MKRLLAYLIAALGAAFGSASQTSAGCERDGKV
jgi:hypothetical protein